MESHQSRLPDDALPVLDRDTENPIDGLPGESPTDGPTSPKLAGWVGGMHQLPEVNRVGSRWANRPFGAISGVAVLGNPISAENSDGISATRV